MSITGLMIDREERENVKIGEWNRGFRQQERERERGVIVWGGA